jgi:hypothetical protein
MPTYIGSMSIWLPMGMNGGLSAQAGSQPDLRILIFELQMRFTIYDLCFT